MNCPDSIMMMPTELIGSSSIDDILGNSRKQPLAWHRQLAIYIEHRIHPEKSLSEIGRLFNRNRTTVRYAIQLVDNIRGQGEDLDEKLSQIERRWKNSRRYKQ